MSQRKLAAILCADVVGYSTLMEADEDGAHRRLKANRETIFDPCITRHGGRIFKLMGDGALIEFTSVVDAVECAIALQAAVAGAADRSIRYRIGVNLGDVIVDGDDLYGDGVNVAARLQTLAPDGGVAISRMVRDNIEGKVTAAFDDLGEHTVKNIQRPVHVYALRAPEPEGPAMRHDDRAGRVSICVLPFANMSGESEQEYFSDGVSEDIITDLSKVSALSVTARNTAFMFKGKNVDVPQVARQLKVGHVLEGSVRKAGNRVRITAQLIDGKTGDHLWAERYDRDMGDIFALQDEIAQAIVAALKIKLLPEERKEIARRGTTDPEAYKLVLMARELLHQGNTALAQLQGILRLSSKAAEIDPAYAEAWAYMARAQERIRRFTGAKDTGLASAERAVDLDPNLAVAHAAKAGSLLSEGRTDDAFGEAETALRLDPDSLDASLAMARYFYATRRYAEAIPHYQKASVSGNDYASVGMMQACLAATGDMEGARDAARRAIELAEKVVAAQPSNGNAMGFIVISLVHLDEPGRAKTWAERALLLDPDNVNMRYNIGCAFARLNDADFALNVLEPVLATSNLLQWAKADADLDSIRDHPRFRAMIAAAEARLGGK